MTMPGFYRSERVGEIFRPDVTSVVQAGMDAGSSPADEDQTRILLLLVDAQIDFVHPQGSLSVPGAVGDTRRTVEWIFRNLRGITTIAASLDSHVPIQIFYPTWWVDADGNHPNAYTVITDEEVSAGRWLPVYEQAWSNSYVEKLETQARKELMIWPYHTMIGSEGHNLMPALYEAIIFHSTARRAQPTLITKGSIPKTEHYSLLEPEVKVLDHPQGQINTDFVKTLATYDRVYIAGQAKSHCVLQTTTSLMNYFAGQAEVIDKLHVLYDCTSSVVHPDIDFDAQANDTFAQYERQGLHLIRSTDSIG